MRPCVGLDEVESKGCGTSGELVDGHADMTNPPSDLVEDYPSRLHININEGSDPDGSLVVDTQLSSSQGSLTQNADSEGFGLPPMLLRLSPEIGRFEVSVLDVAAWSSSPSWSGCGLPDSLGSATHNAAIGAAGFEPSYNNGNAGVDTGAVDSPNRAGQCTSNNGAIFATSDTDAVQTTMVDPVHPMAKACTGTLPLRITHPAPFASHAVRSVSVARVGHHRGGPYVLDSPAGSTSTSISGTFRSCLRPIRTWTAENACSPSPGEARPTKTVRWLDHVAMQAVSEAQSAGFCLPEMFQGGTPEAIRRNPDDTAATADESCTSLYGATGLSVAQFSSLSSPGGLRHPLTPPEGTMDHDIGHEEVKTLEAILSGAAPPPSVPSQPQLQSNTYIQNPSLAEMLRLSPSRPGQHQLPSQLPSQQEEDQPEQQDQQQLEILHRLLSPQMLRALEHSQPISDVHTFTRSDSSEPSIVVVQPRYAAAVEAADVDDYPGSCHVPLDWLNAGCFSDQHDDSSENEDRSGVISVLDSSDGCNGDPCGEFGGGGNDGWGQPQQAHLHYLHQHIQQQNEKEAEVQQQISESEGVRLHQGNSDVSRSGGGGGWGPGAADVERSACGVPASMSLLRTGSTTSASFGFGEIGLINSDSGRAALSEDAGRHITSTPASRVYIGASPLIVAAADGSKRMDHSGNCGVLMAANTGIIGSNLGDSEREAPQAVPEPHQHDGEAHVNQQRSQTSLPGSRMTRLPCAGEPEWGALERSAMRLSDSKMQRVVGLSRVDDGEPDTREGRSAAFRKKYRYQGELAAGDSQRGIACGGQVGKGRGAGFGPLWRLTVTVACWVRNVTPCIAARPATME
ncbi:hypothetical protein VaNZ11_002933 [Volvox africanus]|uniref:Uncharacterized protein n=1 Tax=Volvox africanus TaxID=51714 RepID=A0ABQ5RTD3_9CHLO|nr:hypothetical protein VaNZ11_002933 [Volvox africanus]